MSRILQVFYVLFSAALISLAIPNDIYVFGSPVIAFVSLIPFYHLHTKHKSYMDSALDFALLTFATQLFSSYWLGFFKEFAFVTLFFTCFGTAFQGFAAGLFLYAPYAKTIRTGTLRKTESPLWLSFVPRRTLYFSAVYVSYEWIKSCGFLGYPWGTLSMAQFNFKTLIQIADITGTYGITFLTVMASPLIWETAAFLIKKNPFKKKRKITFLLSGARKNTGFFPLENTWILWLSLMALSLAYGIYQFGKKRPVQKYLNTIMVQQNKDPWKVDDENVTIRLSQELTTRELKDAKENGEKVDLVVWSEGCLRYSFPLAVQHYENHPNDFPLRDFVLDSGVPFIFGGSFVINEFPKQIVNASILYDEKGNFRGYYGKLHLVPFAEVVPFADNPWFSSFLKNTMGLWTGWNPGLQYVLFDIKGRLPEKTRERILPEMNLISLAESLEEQKEKEREPPLVRISTPICYDDAFPDVCSPLSECGSELLMNLTDDSWSMKKCSEYQHFVVSSFRAIELRTTLARSTNSGYTVVVSPTGKVIQDLPLFEETAGLFKIPIYPKKRTTYERLGNWLPHILFIIILSVTIKEWIFRNEEPEARSQRKIKMKKKKRKDGKSKKSGK